MSKLLRVFSSRVELTADDNPCRDRASTHRLAATCAILLLFAGWPVAALGETDAPANSPRERKLFDGIMTDRIVPGEPYDLDGKRIFFTNWYYIQPGDLDWRDKDGKSVYTVGDLGPLEAHHIGINAPHGIQIVAQKPVIQGPYERPGRVVLHDGGVYKCWGVNDYYESRDAINWEPKAKLKLGAPLKAFHGHVFVDPVAPADERYKTIWVDTINREQFEEFRKRRPEGWEPRSLLHYGESGEASCLRGAVSADGIEWKTLPDPIVVEYSDTLNTGYFDTVAREYVLFTRYWAVGPSSDKVPANIRGSWTGVGRRSIGRTASSDFKAFTPSEKLLEPSMEMRPSEVLYSNCYTTIPGTRHLHLMFPAVWNGSVDDTTRIFMATSNDGRVWNWVPGGDIFRTQKFGGWNGGAVWATPNLIELPNGDWALPYLAHNVPHKYPRGKRLESMGYAVWPKGRMICVEADDQAEFTLMPVMPAGRKLKINAATSRTGWVKVEVGGTTDRRFDDCEPIFGDQYWTQVSWNGKDDIGVSDTEPMTLRIKMYQAQLYGLEFE